MSAYGSDGDGGPPNGSATACGRRTKCRSGVTSVRLQAALAERAQAEQRLDPGDAAAGDDNTPRLDARHDAVSASAWARRGAATLSGGHHRASRETTDVRSATRPLSGARRKVVVAALEHLRADHRTRRRRRDRSPGALCDLVRHALCLLGADAAVLEQSCRGVADGVDAVPAGHVSADVDGDEAVIGSREPADGWRPETGQRDDLLGLQDRAGAAHETAGQVDLGDLGGAHESDVRGAQCCDDVLRRLDAEQRERCRLGRHDAHVGVDAVQLDVRGGHERELVERQRPRDTGGDDERDAAARGRPRARAARRT